MAWLHCTALHCMAGHSTHTHTHTASAVEDMQAFLKGTFDGSPEETAVAVAAKARELQTNSALAVTDRVRVYCGAAFSSATLLADVMDAGKTLPLAKICEGVQRLQIAAIEEVMRLSAGHSALVEAAHGLLMALYNNDVVEESAALAWDAAKVGRVQGVEEEVEVAFRAAAQRFIEFLKEDSDGDDSSASSSDEDDSDSE